MEKKVEVQVKVYGTLKGACGVECKTLLVPIDCTEAFAYVLEWFQMNSGLDASKVLLLYNDVSAIKKTHMGQMVKSGDVFKLLPLISGG